MADCQLSNEQDDSSTTLIKHSSSSLNVTGNSTFNESSITLYERLEKIKLQPTDGGQEAWTFMLGAILIDAAIWALPLNFGVFQNYYISHEPFLGNNYISMIGTFATGIAYVGGPLMTPITIRYHNYRQYLVLFGTALCIIGNIGASFATNAEVMILCQGVLYGVGFLIISYCSFSMLNEWFVQRRGLAYGILLSASGMSGIGLPFLLQTLLSRYGHAVTLRIYALTTVVIVSPAILLLRSRTQNLHVTPTENKRRNKFDYSSLRKPIFINLSTCNFLQGLVFYLPGIFLPSFATSLSLTETQSSIVLALLNLTSVLGTLVFGYLSDIIDFHILLFISTLSSSIVVFMLWGLGHSFLSLSFFATAYGFLAGSFESLFPRFATAMTEDADAEITFYGFFEFERGLGMVLAGPIGSVLVQRFKYESMDRYAGGQYVGIVVFVGVVLGVSSLAGTGWFFRRNKWYR